MVGGCAGDGCKGKSSRVAWTVLDFPFGGIGARSSGLKMQRARMDYKAI